MDVAALLLELYGRTPPLARRRRRCRPRPTQRSTVSRHEHELFGWAAQEPSAEFGGYFMFTRNGIPVAGAMGDMGDMPADDSWKIYLATDDLAKTLETAEVEGAQILSPAMAVADLGIQAVLVDPTGARLGAWQPGTFPGFTVLHEHGTPSG